MKVLHVIPSLDPLYGGPVAALVGLAEAQKAAGMDVSVLATQKADITNSVSERLLRNDIKVRVIGPATGPLLRHPQLAKAVNEEVASADVIHIHGLWEEIQHQAALAARRQQKPYLVRACGMLDPWSLAQSRVKKQLYMRWRLRNDLNCAAALHFTSGTERKLADCLNFKARSLVEPNGISLGEFETLPEPESFRKRHQTIGSRPIILFLSRLHPKKGLDLLVPAFAKAQAPDAVLVIAGPDENRYRAEIEAMVTKHHLTDRVIFTGMLQGEERIAALTDASLFVLPSYQENFGNVVIEALATGTPVIISDQVNIHDQITAAGVGGVVPLDVGALSDELTRWMNDDGLRREAANRARPFVRAQYDWRQIAEHWREHYNRLVSHSFLSEIN